MEPIFSPFTPEEFHKQTGLTASDNEAIYIRWVNTQINYANYQTMKEMVASLKEIRSILKENQVQGNGKFPFVK
jgi:hypothetical protein